MIPGRTHTIVSGKVIVEGIGEHGHVGYATSHEDVQEFPSGFDPNLRSWICE